MSDRVDTALAALRAREPVLDDVTQARVAARLEVALSAAPAPAPAPIDPTPDPALDFLSAEHRADRARIVAALAEYAGNQTRAARALGMSRSTLVTKMALYRIPRPRT